MNATNTTSEVPLTKLKCLVTGASSGIGKATCGLLSSRGANVVGVARRANALEELQTQGHLKELIVADLTSQGACQSVVKEAAEKLGGLTTVVNCAGALQGGAAGSANLSNYHYNMTINAQVPFEIMTHSIEYLEKYPNLASIVNVSSVNGKQAFAGCLTYCMAKAALDQMARCASVDLAAKGIRVNNVNPGVVVTNLHKAGGLNDDQYAAFLERSVQVTHPLSHSLGRVGTAQEVAALIAFLVSDQALFLTGECIAIDGGRQNLGAR